MSISPAYSIRNILYTVGVWTGMYAFVCGTGIVGLFMAVCYPVAWAVQRGRGIYIPHKSIEEYQQDAIHEFMEQHPNITCTILKNEAEAGPILYQFLCFYPSAFFQTRVNPIFLIHGVNSHPFMWKCIIPELCSLGYTVYCPELPGFGVVPISTPGESPEEWLSIYAQYLKKAMDEIRIQEKPILVGHSFGASICSQFCILYPDSFREMIFVNPMSLLPTLHERTPFWAVLFNHFPFCIIRLLGSVLYPYFPPKDRHDMLEMSRFVCRENKGNSIVSQFIQSGPIISRWKGPCLFTRLLPLSHRISAISTMEDTISPAYALTLFFKVASSSHSPELPEIKSLILIPGKSHNPARCDTRAFMDAFVRLLNDLEKKPVPLDPLYPSRAIPQDLFDACIEAHGWSLFDMTITRQNIQNLVYYIEQTKYVPIHVKDIKGRNASSPSFGMARF